MGSVGVQDEEHIIELTKEEHEFSDSHQVSFSEEMRIVSPESVEKRTIRVELN